VTVSRALERPEHEQKLPAPLRLAREHRRAERIVQPYELWRACNEQYPRDDRERGQLYHHALVEAGFIRRRRDGRAFNPCTICGDELGPVLNPE
jgi:hypothetical protein